MARKNVEYLASVSTTSGVIAAVAVFAGVSMYMGKVPLINATVPNVNAVNWLLQKPVDPQHFVRRYVDPVILFVVFAVVLAAVISAVTNSFRARHQASVYRERLVQVRGILDRTFLRAKLDATDFLRICHTVFVIDDTVQTFNGGKNVRGSFDYFGSMDNVHETVRLDVESTVDVEALRGRLREDDLQFRNPQAWYRRQMTDHSGKAWLQWLFLISVVVAGILVLTTAITILGSYRRNEDSAQWSDLVSVRMLAILLPPLVVLTLALVELPLSGFAYWGDMVTFNDSPDEDLDFMLHEVYNKLMSSNKTAETRLYDARKVWRRWRPKLNREIERASQVVRRQTWGNVLAIAAAGASAWAYVRHAGDPFGEASTLQRVTSAIGARVSSVVIPALVFALLLMWLYLSVANREPR